ncbi:MAG: hypothetical protein RXR06_10760 [Thermoproteus sp.]
MPKPLLQPKAQAEEAAVEPASPVAATPPQPPPARQPPPQLELILALYKECVNRGYANCDVLKQMARDKIIDYAKAAVVAELERLGIAEEVRELGDEICIKL